jgi:hypothetical protein
MAVAVLSLAPVASASSVGYGADAKVESAATSQGTSGGGGGDLPFTGLDVGIVALAGIALVGAGFGLRRVQGRGAA